MQNLKTRNLIMLMKQVNLERKMILTLNLKKKMLLRLNQEKKTILMLNLEKKMILMLMKMKNPSVKRRQNSTTMNLQQT